MFIDKLCIALKGIISKVNKVILEHVLITNDVSVATDGKILIEIDNPKIDPQDYPLIEGLINISDKSVLLHRNTLTQVEKNIPHKINLPILNNAMIRIRNNNDKELAICTTDLTNHQIITQKVFDWIYPDYNKVYPQEKPVFEIRLSIAVLNRLIKTMSKINKEGTIDFTFYGDKQAVKFESIISGMQRKVKGLIMPVYKKEE